jgi:hypothetical protein
MRLRRQAAAAGGGRWPLPACLPACCWLARRLAASPAALWLPAAAAAPRWPLGLGRRDPPLSL